MTSLPQKKIDGRHIVGEREGDTKGIRILINGYRGGMSQTRLFKISSVFTYLSSVVPIISEEQILNIVDVKIQHCAFMHNYVRPFNRYQLGSTVLFF